MNHKDRLQRRARVNGKRQQRGFTLLMMALASVVLFGAMGLAVDLGRVYIAKNEAQSFADAAALAAALKLDGTSAGVTAAQSAATALPDQWNFRTSSFTGTTVQVATSLSGTWVSANSPPSPATNYIYVKVTATAAVPIYFLPVVTAFAGGGVATTSTVNASATAGQVAYTASASDQWNEGLFPFSPIAFDGPTGGSFTASSTPGDPWGFVPGTQYTMRYASNGKSSCAGDSGDSEHIKDGSARGFWGDNAASAIAAQVLGDLQEESLYIGEVLPGVGGAKTTVATDIEDRVDQDLDTSDDTYSAYLNASHNGRRVVIMPLQSEVDSTVLAFGSFLLMDDGAYDHTGNSNWCAIFIGVSTVTDNGGGSGASSTIGPTQVKLVQ